MDDDLEILTGDIVLASTMSWDGFTFAAVKDRSTDTYHVVMIQKDGTTIRSRPYGFETHAIEQMAWASKVGQITEDMRDLAEPEQASTITSHPLYGRYS